MTQEEFFSWCGTVPAHDLHHYELLDGFVVMQPPDPWPHGQIAAEVSHRVSAFTQANSSGPVLGSRQGFDLPTGDTVEPDLSFVSNERWATTTPHIGEFLAVVPDLVVEVLSPSTRKIDQEQKRRIYERNGVREYWLADPPSKSVRCLFLTSDRFGDERVFSDGDILVSRVLPGLEIQIRELFAEA